MANDNFLPRINVTLNDQGLKIAPPPAGNKVTLLGITSNQAVTKYEPYVVASAEEAMNTLWASGSSGGTYPSELALAIEQAVTAGAPSIEVMVIGHYSGAALESYVNPKLSQTGRFVDLSGAYEVLKNRDNDVVVPVGAYIDTTGLSASQNFGKQLADFCYQATTDYNATVGVISVAPVTAWAQLFSGSLTGNANAVTEFATEVNSIGYSDGDTYFHDPSTALVTEWYDYHANPDGATRKSDLTAYNPVYAAWLSGAYDSSNNRFSSAATSSQLSPHYFSFWQAKKADGTLATDSRGVKVDAGAYINVLAASVKSIGTLVPSLAAKYSKSLSTTSYVSDGAAAYAGLVTSLAPQSAPTNKYISGLTSLKLLSPAQANILVGMRFVTMYQRTRGFVVASGVTGAYSVNQYLRSDYVRLSTVRITQSAVDLIRAVGDKYIGEPNNGPQLNALNNEIESVLLSMKGAGAITDFDFTVSATPEQRVLGELDVNLTLVPAFEIRQINLVVSLTPSI